MKNNNHNYKDYDKALNKQKERYLKRVKSMMKKALYSCYFITFTFSNKMLLETTQKTRERYIKEWLRQQATEYILNCDYGEKKGREHYHAFIISRYKVINYNTTLKHNIFIYSKKITKTIYNAYTPIKDERRYITADEELTAHAFKKTTKGAKIIYSRPNKTIKINDDFKKGANAKLSDYRKSDQRRENKALYKALIKGDRQTYINHFKTDELDEIFNDR